MWLCSRLPYPLQIKIGAGLGRLSYWLLPGKRKIAAVNIGLCFPELSIEEQTALVRDTFRSTGITVMETGLSWWGRKKALLAMIHIDGMEHMEAALEKGKGVIMLGGHFTCMIICGRLLALQLPYNAVVKEAHNGLFNSFMNHFRTQQYQGLIDSKNTRGMLRVLKQNQVLWYAPDQDFGRERSVFADFMGVPTATLTSTSRLAKASGAQVIPIDFERLPDNQGYRMRLQPALEEFPCGDDQKDARRINEHLERQVWQVPDQYLWLHRRFKTRPEGEPDVYQ